MFFVLGAQTVQHGRVHNDEELEIRLITGAFLQDFLELALNSRSHQPVESRPAALRDRYAHQAVGEAIRRDLPAPHIGP